jgi:hypothetical protein
VPVTAFNERPFNMRFAEMGDQAEGVFEDVWPGAWERYGLNRPKLNMAKLTPFVRCTPDYIAHDGLVEVMGVGRDHTFKLKQEKYEALQDWEIAAKTPVKIFLFDSHKSRWSIAPLADVVSACLCEGTAKAFHDGPRYVALDLKHWPSAVWTPYAPSAPDEES